MNRTLQQAVDKFTLEQLKNIAKFFTSDKLPTKKVELADLVAVLIRKHLSTLWDKLDATEKAAVAETLYSNNGLLDTQSFKAKYGKLPASLRRSDGYGRMPPLESLFLYHSMSGAVFGLAVPEDIRPLLLKFVPAPAPAKLPAVECVPESFEQIVKTYEMQPEDSGIEVHFRKRRYVYATKPPIEKTTVEHVPIESRLMARAALQDLHTVMRLVAQGKILVGEKTGVISAKAAKDVAALLWEGDFYEIVERKESWEQEIGPVRAFAWPLLLQASNLVELHGKKLAFTRAGVSALNAPAHETIRLIWRRWIKSSMFDEFQRIESIKGQSSKSRRHMTALEPRRLAITGALAKCPVGKWVKIDDFDRQMQIEGDVFEVTHNLYNLYIGDQNYGNLERQGAEPWAICQNRYIRCLLFEYAATLGLVDVAFVLPQEVKSNFDDLWGTDNLKYLSRYDGLLYFRLNALGAYCLGLTNDYEASATEAVKLSVIPSMQISILEDSVSPQAALLLDAYAERESPKTWRLAKHKALAAIEEGHQISQLHDFLKAGDEQPLPETVEAFIRNADKGARALKNVGLALLIECVDAKTADAIAEHKCTKEICQRAGARALVVPVVHESRL
ncbi:MAG: hypothetical protein JST01_22755 [Cyanobacteria bacterium SZAS TMP-1]|nr:hypothetical protein [Cyanobacteria bacterium SZAS TMP-1]